MKRKLFVVSLLALILSGCSSDSYDDSALWNKVNSLDNRVTAIEATLARMNTDLNSISVLVNTLKTNVYITNVQETYIGYVITFSDNRVITIQSGKDGKDGQTPYIGSNGNWWIGTNDTGVSATGRDGRDGKDGTDGFTPYIGYNGNWWVNNEDTGVKAAGADGKNGTNGKDGTDGKDGLTPRIGTNGNWWLGDEDTGVYALGKNGRDGYTPNIGPNGNWWINGEDTGVPATGANGSDGQNWGGTAETPIISIELYEGHYYWVQIVNNVKTFILNVDGEKIPVEGRGLVQPIIRVNINNYWEISFDGGVTFVFILGPDGNPYQATGNCECKSFFQSVDMVNGYLIIVLADGTVLRFYVGNGISEDYPNTAIPYEYHRNPYLHNVNTTIPSGANFAYTKVNGSVMVRIILPGVPKPSSTESESTGWVDMIGTDQPGHNTWIEIDDEPRGNVVEEASEQNQIKTDIVFLVDNSGSMSEEADAVARDIIAWAKSLASSGLDVRFGCVGYSVDGKINGAIDLTTSTQLSSYLNASTGTNRTVGFASTKLKNAASGYSVSDECGGMALRYADANISFRSGANRIYVNFTDEPNQPNGKAEYSVYFFQNQSNWPSSKGTVYTVYSGSTNASWKNYYVEQPWLISNFTGGSTFYTNSSFTGVTLSDLPVTGAMTHTHAIYFTDVSQKFDKTKHKIKLTIFEPDGSIQAEREWNVTFGSLD